MKISKTFPIILFLMCIVLVSCDKGYQVRFTNYYIEPVDSVVIGNDKIVFKSIDLETSTGYTSLSKGSYGIQIITKSKKRFYTSIFISSKGTGKRTIQIDGIEQISILEE